MPDDNPQTEEDMIQFVQDKICETLISHEKTKEDVQASRNNMFKLYDAATTFHLEEAEKCGAEIGDMKMTVEFLFNKELGAWELLALRQRFPVDLPNFPIKRLVGVYTVDPKFWKEVGKNKDDGDE